MSFISPEFLLTSLLVVLRPGTGMLYTIATGLAAGRRRSLRPLSAATPRVSFRICFLPPSPVWRRCSTAHRNSSGAIKISQAAAAVHGMEYAALSRARSRQRAIDEADSPLKIITHAVMINLSTPKLPLFFSPFLPQFIRSERRLPGKRC